MHNNGVVFYAINQTAKRLLLRFVILLPYHQGATIIPPSLGLSSHFPRNVLLVFLLIRANEIGVIEIKCLNQRVSYGLQ